MCIEGVSTCHMHVSGVVQATHTHEVTNVGHTQTNTHTHTQYKHTYMRLPRLDTHNQINTHKLHTHIHEAAKVGHVILKSPHTPKPSKGVCK